MNVMFLSTIPSRQTAIILALSTGLAGAAWAQAPRAAPQGQTSVPLGGFSENSKDPIKIDADRLDVFDKESRAVFAGNVVAVQGKTTIRCSKMTIFYNNRGQGPAGQAARPTPAATAPAGDGGIKRLECDGPVVVTSEDQVATGDKAVFDREKDTVILTGKVALAKGQNVTKGDRLVYNTKTGIANIDGGRVQGFFVPGSEDAGAAPKPAPRRPAGGAAPTN
jgi:lipopolysaccharide export system protein LptA